MMKGVLQSSTKVCCPTCFETDHIVYRREPTDDSSVLNHCRCNRCGEWFVVEEDKHGLLKAH